MVHEPFRIQRERRPHLQINPCPQIQGVIRAHPQSIKTAGPHLVNAQLAGADGAIDRRNAGVSQPVQRRGGLGQPHRHRVIRIDGEPARIGVLKLAAPLEHQLERTAAGTSTTGLGGQQPRNKQPFGANQADGATIRGHQHR